MKRLNLPKTGIAVLCCTLLLLNAANAQDKEAELLLKLAYFNSDNTIPHLQVSALEKSRGKLLPLAHLPVQLFLKDSSAAHRIGQVTTDAMGKAVANIPPSLQTEWKAANTLNFIAISSASKAFAAQTKIISITKARLLIDTLAGEDGAKNITATVQELQGDSLINVKDVELKIGVQRMSSLLPVGESETYTTDSTGVATATFTRNTLPGDAQGNLMLVARMEDNDNYGTLSITKTVPWGIIHQTDDFSFNKRSIWATNKKAPIALMTVAYTLIISVWGILLYLILQIFKIRRMGKTFVEQC